MLQVLWGHGVQVLRVLQVLQGRGVQGLQVQGRSGCPETLWTQACRLGSVPELWCGVPHSCPELPSPHMPPRLLRNARGTPGQPSAVPRLFPEHSQPASPAMGSVPHLGPQQALCQAQLCARTAWGHGVQVLRVLQVLQGRGVQGLQVQGRSGCPETLWTQACRLGSVPELRCGVPHSCPELPSPHMPPRLLRNACGTPGQPSAVPRLFPEHSQPASPAMGSVPHLGPQQALCQAQLCARTACGTPGQPSAVPRLFPEHSQPASPAMGSVPHLGPQQALCQAQLCARTALAFSGHLALVSGSDLPPPPPFGWSPSILSLTQSSPARLGALGREAGARPAGCPQRPEGPSGQKRGSLGGVHTVGVRGEALKQRQEACACPSFWLSKHGRDPPTSHFPGLSWAVGLEAAETPASSVGTTAQPGSKPGPEAVPAASSQLRPAQKTRVLPKRHGWHRTAPGSSADAGSLDVQGAGAARLRSWGGVSARGRGETVFL